MGSGPDRWQDVLGELRHCDYLAEPSRWAPPLTWQSLLPRNSVLAAPPAAPCVVRFWHCYMRKAAHSDACVMQ
jgi:hypothetical protein